MGEDFWVRKAVGNPLEERLIRKLEHQKQTTGNIWKRTGIEFDSTAHRYTPDFLVTTSKSLIYFDTKASKTIEHDCYQHYLSLRKQGYQVWLVFDWNGELIAISVDDLKLIDNPNYNNSWGFPCRGPWRYPRDSTRYWEWKERNPNASGCPLAYINFFQSPYKVIPEPPC